MRDELRLVVKYNGTDSDNYYRIYLGDVLIDGDGIVSDRGDFLACVNGTMTRLAAEYDAGTLEPFTRQYHGECDGREGQEFVNADDVAHIRWRNGFAPTVR